MLAEVAAVGGGGQGPWQGTKDRSGAVVDAHARYQEAVYRGSVFVLDSDSVTLAAANATKGAAGTIKLVNGFFNPQNSQKHCVVWYAVVATVSGTPAGPFFWNFQTCSAITSASTGTVRNAILGAGAASVVVPQVNVVVTRQDANTAAFTQAATIGGPTAVAAAGANETALEETAGRIIVPPGTIFGIAAAGAGTTHIVQSTVQWEEISI